MEFIEIKSHNDNHFEKLLALYQDAFPENQRRTQDDFKKLIESENALFHCNAVILNGSFVGFFNYWKFETFIFAEHFAIEESVRGNKIGEKVMKMIQSNANLPLVFEVELPDDEINARRIEFYLRLGYEIIPIDYLQPPYNKNGFWQPLHLMTDELQLVVKGFEQVKNIIYKFIYNV